jgi:hypothetical protein
MLETEDREICGRRYYVTTLPAKKGRAVLVRLTKVLGPVFGQLVSGDAPATAKHKAASAERIAAQINGASIARALAELAGRLSEADLDWLCETLGESTEVQTYDGAGEERRQRLTAGEQQFHFAGKFLEMFSWLGFALEVNFRDFFTGSPIGSAIVRAAGAVAAKTVEASSPSQSPGE